MVVRMRDLLPASAPIALLVRPIEAKAFFVDPGMLKLVVLPRLNRNRRKFRSMHLRIDMDQRLALLVALLEPSEDDVIPERAQPYEGPVKGVATRIGMIDTRTVEAAIEVEVSAAAPKGFKENPGDVFLTIAPKANVAGGGRMVFRLDRGAKRFLISQLEQSITIEGMHFETAAKRNWLQRALDRARAYLKETGAD